MIFKVLYQEDPNEIATRERTKSIYIEADSIRDARKKLANKTINIEYIQPLNKAHLAYEKQSENFELETI
ncbi:DUF1447 family protein [Cerasibacillus terrae]|uniref:DNA-directed RNA polymerase subunit epsilon n=1 Tax=Cerasibacillus terrae TaxID=2498845 RepID=A0A5C8P1R9_9BACI|nr:DNA-directed RNA polymerase subunit epsilon [Cerasibacillus terrae]TXL67550.1 DUF1447 family protein [Cerasibacillus terrae]